jgi:hypothetical protein
MADVLLSTEDACALLAGLSRSSLYKWYGDLREPTTPGKKGPVAWNERKLLQRQRELSRVARLARAS